jgi:hypothetical protein
MSVMQELLACAFQKVDHREEWRCR